MIVYLARDIPAFVMYCVNGESGSSLLIESTDSMMSSTQSGNLRNLQIVLRYLRKSKLRTQSATQSRDPRLRMNSLHARAASHARAVVLATFPRSPP